MQRTTTITFVAGLIAATATAQTQGPDILIPSHSIDGAFALVDKDKDGKYTTAGEAWDYTKALNNTGPHNFVMIGSRIFFSDRTQDQIHWIEDSNGDGKIDPATERGVFFDLKGIVGGTSPRRA